MLITKRQKKKKYADITKEGFVNRKKDWQATLEGVNNLLDGCHSRDKIQECKYQAIYLGTKTANSAVNGCFNGEND